MPDGEGDYKIGSAYYEVHLRDETQADSEKIKDKVGGQKPVEIPTKLKDPDPGPLTEKYKNAPPVEIPTKADNPIDDAWRQRIRESLKRTAFESLQIDLTPETEKWRRDLAELIKETEKAVSAKIPADLDKAVEFKEQVQLLALLASEETRVRIPVEVDEDKAQAALRDLTTKVDSANTQNTGSFKNMATSTGAVWAGLGALLAGPLVIGALGLTATAVTGIAIAAEHSSPQVVQAFQTMKTEGADLLKNGFASMTPAIVSSMNAVTDGLRGAQPQIQALSAQLGPFLTTFTGTLVQVAQTTLPAFTQTLAAAAPFAQQMARGIQDLANGVSNFFTHLDFSQASAGFQLLLTDVGQLLPVIGNLVNAVMPFANALLSSVIPAATNLANAFIGDLAPAIRAFGSAISALGPVLDFMSGPTAAVLTGVVAFKALQATTSGLLSVFNTVSGAASSLANRVLQMSGSGTSSVGTFNLMTDSMKKQAVQAAASALATAQQTAAQAASNLATVEAAAASGTATISETELTAARAAATAATTAEAEATTALATASRASSFAFGPVGIALGALAGLMALFSTTTKSDATPAVQNFTQQLNQLATAGPAAAKGILQQDPALAKLVNQAAEAGVSVGQLNDALQSGGQAQDAVAAKIRSVTDSLGAQNTEWRQTNDMGGWGEASKNTSTSIKALSDSIGNNKDELSKLTPEQQAAVQKYRDLQDLLNTLGPSFGQNSAAIQAAGNVAGQSVQLTALQQNAATEVAQKFGLSVGTVVSAFERLPGAGADGAAGVAQVTSAFSDGEVKFLNAEHTFTDYFKNLQKSADQANQSLASSQHSYQQSVTAVSDAEHSAAQATQAVTTARQGVVTATRAVTDAEHSYVDAEHSVAQAHQAVKDAEDGVIVAENNLAKAQESEREAQVALTKAREDAAEQLKSLHLQLNDQIASEQRAQIALFDQVAKSGAQGVTKDNAQAILAQPLTTQNEALKKSALDLIDAENSLADTMNTGANLRKQVAQADQAGVDGSQQVVSAQRALKSAQDQVASSSVALQKSRQQVTQATFALQDAEYALGKAHQAILDAQANVVKSEQAVKDAVWNEQKARLAVKDAIWNEHEALLALKTAQDAARTANDLNTTSLDLNTQAGRNNWAQLQTLYASYPQWWTDQQKYNQMVNDTAGAFNGSKQAAFDFLQQEGKIPKTYTFSVEGMTTVNMAPLANWANDTGYFKGGFRSAGGQIAFASGGHVKGPGGPTDDLIDAKLSDNEFVQPSDVVDHYGVGYMEALRQKKIPRFAKGGYVDGVQLNLLAAGFGTGYEFIRNAEILAGADPGALPQLPAYQPPTMGGGGGPNGPIPTGQHLALIDAALAADGIPRSDWPRWEAGMNVLIQRESTWNPNSVNNWDANAKAGHPSGGLTQTIYSTFEGHRNRSLPDNMFDPVANIAASINYILWKYHDISNVQQANPNLPPKGYANGDIVGTDGSSLLGVMAPEAQIVPPNSRRLVGDARVPESYIPNEPRDPRAQQILSETNKRMGRSNNAPVVNITLHTNETDPERLASLVSSRIGWAMRGV